MKVDVAIVGAGAAGLFCAARAGQRGLSVVVVDHAQKLAEKIRISGGGRCNFTNVDASPANFVSANPDFCRSALARFTPADFVALVERHGIAWHEKHKGQLFCDDSSNRIVRMLLDECDAGGVRRWQPCRAGAVQQRDDGIVLDTERGPLHAAQLVVATGGLSIPKIGASDWGYRLARQFGHAVIATRPALVPFVLDGAPWQRFAALAGVSLPVRVEAGSGEQRGEFAEDLLFTHRGLSGPAALQASTYWHPGEPITLDLAPARDLRRTLAAARHVSGRRLGAALVEVLPRRLAEAWLATTPELAGRLVADLRDRDLTTIADGLHRWLVVPAGTEGYRTAEVTAGGVDTRELESRSGRSRRVPRLFFIGEVVDVTGWLGGYNFQWAWASAAACAGALEAATAAPSGRL